MQTTYSVDTAGITKDGSVINVGMAATPKEYTVELNGNEVGTYKFLETAKVTSDTETAFLIRQGCQGRHRV